MDTESPGQEWVRAGWLWKSDPFLGLDSWGLRKGERETVFAQKKKNQAAEGTCARRTKLAFCCEKIQVQTPALLLPSGVSQEPPSETEPGFLNRRVTIFDGPALGGLH